MKSSLEISNRRVGLDYKPLVIAEIGINHEGSLKTAFEMVDAAYKAGAEIIKHQTHVVEDEMSKEAKKVIPGNTNVSIYEVMQRCALSEEDEIKLKEYVESKGMIFLSTPFSRAAADRLERMNVVAYKIGSGEMNNYPLLDHIASFGKPMIVSTGMNNIESVRKAVDILEKHDIQYALLHTTNLYPTPVHLVRLGAMQELQKEFPNGIIGLSDHTTSNRACFAATALGAFGPPCRHNSPVVRCRGRQSSHGHGENAAAPPIRYYPAAGRARDWLRAARARYRPVASAAASAWRQRRV